MSTPNVHCVNAASNRFRLNPLMGGCGYFSTDTSMAAGWTTEETRALVSIWGQENVQSELDVVQRNLTIYKWIARELKDRGFDKTWQQCRTKVKN